MYKNTILNRPCHINAKILHSNTILGQADFVIHNTNEQIQIVIVYCKTGSKGASNPTISIPQYYIPMLN